MKVTLCIDSKESIEIGYSDVASLIGWLDDDMRYAFSFLNLVNHPSSEVRCAVAGKSLPIEVLEVLALDASIEVVRQIANNELALKSFELPLVHEMILRDVSVATEIAENLHLLSENVRIGVIQTLLQHEDPKVSETAEKFGNDW